MLAQMFTLGGQGPQGRAVVRRNEQSLLQAAVRCVRLGKIVDERLALLGDLPQFAGVAVTEPTLQIALLPTVTRMNLASISARGSEAYGFGLKDDGANARRRQMECCHEAGVTGTNNTDIRVL